MKDTAMEECQAVITRIPLPLRLLWHYCHRCCCGVASVGVPRRSGKKQFQQSASVLGLGSSGAAESVDLSRAPTVSVAQSRCAFLRLCDKFLIPSSLVSI